MKINVNFPNLAKIQKKLESQKVENLDLKVRISSFSTDKLGMIEKKLLCRLVSLGVVNGPNNIEYLMFGLRLSDFYKINIDKEKKEITFYLKLIYEE